MIWIVVGGIPLALFLALIIWIWVQQFGGVVAMIMVGVVAVLVGCGFALSYGSAQLGGP